MNGTVFWLLRYARPATARLAGSIAARVVGHSLGAAALALPAWAVGMLASGAAGGAAFVVLIVALVVACHLLRAGLRYLEQLLGHLAAFGLMGELRVDLLDRLATQAPAVTDGAGAARIQTIAVRDVDRVEVFFAHTIAPAVSAVMLPLAATIVAWGFAGPAVAAALAVVLVAGLVLPLFGARGGLRRARAVADARADIAQHVADTLRIRDDIRAFGAESARLDAQGAADARLGRSLRAAGRRSGARQAASNLRVWLGTLAVVLVGIATAPNLADALPGLLVAAALVAGTIASLDTVERLATSLPAGLEAARRVRAQLDAPPMVNEPPMVDNPERVATAPRADSAHPAAPALELREVTFTYPGADTPALQGVNLRLERGEMVGVVGATGSAKSTLVRLAQRHWDPQHGEVLVDGVAAPQLGSAEVARRVVVADQDPFLLEGSIAENLRLADASVRDAWMRWALEFVGLGEAHGFGPEAQVGRRGARLSGGQRQRLALARTLVRAAPELQRGVLVLDEATSHQDPLTQAALVAKLRGLGASMLVVAHRLETLRDADRIVVLERGRVVESGTWPELVAAGGAFAALLAAQPTNS